MKIYPNNKKTKKKKPKKNPCKKILINHKKKKKKKQPQNNNKNKPPNKQKTFFSKIFKKSALGGRQRLIDGIGPVRFGDEIIDPHKSRVARDVSFRFIS
jgi:hypothetical protein